MATVIRGSQDELLLEVKSALDEYEQENPDSIASLFRVNSGVIWVRVVSDVFRSMAPDDRHEKVWRFLCDHLPGDDAEEISALILLTHAEQNTSFLNREFNDPVAIRMQHSQSEVM